MVKRPAGKRDRVKNENPDRNQGLRGYRIPSLPEKNPAGNQSCTEKKSAGRADFRWNEIVFERILQSQRGGKKQRQAPQPREELDANKLLPIECRSVRRLGGEGCPERRRCY